MEKKEYLETRRKAFRYLKKGILFLAVCLAVGQIAEYFKIPFHNLITESTTIAGWVALWKPIEMFLYDLPELRKKNR